MSSLNIFYRFWSFASLTTTLVCLCSEFYCFQRIFVYVFVPWSVYTAFALTATYASPVYHPASKLSRYDFRKWRIVMGFLFTAWMLAYCMLVLFPVACDSNPGLLGCYWNSPVGRSSCTSQSGITQTYNANGALLPPQTATTANMICVIDDARYADGNGLSVLTYPALYGTTYPNTDAAPCPTTSPCLATNRTQDYPNPALGVVNGLFFLNQTAQIGLCPGNVIRNAQVVGQNVCPYCLACWRVWYGYADPRFAHCPPQQASCTFWCDSACPFVSETRTTAAVLIEFAVLLSLAFTPQVEWLGEEVSHT